MKPLEEYYHILDRLGRNTIQNYIINLGKEDTKDLDYVPDMEVIIKLGSKILDRLFVKKLVVKDLTKKGEISKIMIIPMIKFDLNNRVKFYPVLEDVPEYNRHTFSIDDKKYSLILHNKFGVSRVSFKCLNVLKKLSSVPVCIDSSYSDFKRIAKKETAYDEDNYKLETELFKHTQKKYNNKVVYYHYRFDNRGRMYANSYTLNPQGDQYSKAAITFANKEIISEEGVKYLIYDIANNYGLDKCTRNQKLEWFNDNKNRIIELGSKQEIDMTADKPLLFLKGCKAYIDYLEGNESGYVCQMDATASFGQIGAILARDKNQAIITNLTDDDNRYDLYTEVIKEFIKVAKLDLNLKEARSLYKAPIMVY